MDRSHVILDAIRLRKIAFPMPKDAATIYRHQAEELLDVDKKIIEVSQKFDVSAIIPFLGGALFETAVEATENNMLPLPFRFCFFDFGSLQFARVTEDTSPLLMGKLCLLTEEKEDCLCVSRYTCIDDRWIKERFKVDVLKGQPRDRMFRIMPDKWLPSGINISDDDRRICVETAQKLIQVLACMETSHVHFERVTAPAKLNKARTARGKPLLSEHTIVTIDMSSITEKGDATGAHASPRLHWRRGHIRTLQSGAKIKVKPCLVGNPTLGVVDHKYRIKDGTKDGTAPAVSPT
jgi:hypothetical protein